MVINYCILIIGFAVFVGMCVIPALVSLSLKDFFVKKLEEYRNADSSDKEKQTKSGCQHDWFDYNKTSTEDIRKQFIRDFETGGCKFSVRACGYDSGQIKDRGLKVTGESDNVSLQHKTFIFKKQSYYKSCCLICGEFDGNLDMIVATVQMWIDDFVDRFLTANELVKSLEED